MSEENCGNCRFWLGEDGRTGECRRNPPTVLDDNEEFQFPEMSRGDWCGEWRAKGASGTAGKLYQLPNGQHIYPDDVRGVATLKGGYSSDARADLAPRVQVRLCDRGLYIIQCDTLEAAEDMRDKIAADVNAMVGGAA